MPAGPVAGVRVNSAQTILAGLHKPENPRVAGSIPALATISNSMICNRFRVSPADYLCPDGTDPRTIGKWVGGAIPAGAGSGELASWEPGKLAA